MRISGVLLCAAIVGVVSGFGGHYFATRQCHKETTRLARERDLGLSREQELRTQLEDALAARATLAREARQLQANLSGRLKRLEEIVARSAPQPDVTQEQKSE